MKCIINRFVQHGREASDFRISRVTPCLGNSYDTVEFITAWQVIPKQAATQDFPKYPVSHPVSVIATTRLDTQKSFYMVWLNPSYDTFRCRFGSLVY